MVLHRPPAKPDDEPGAQQHEHCSGNPGQVQGDSPEAEELELVQEQGRQQLAGDGYRHGRGGPQAGNDQDNRKDKKSPHQPAGEFPPGGLGQGPEGSPAEDHGQENRQIVPTRKETVELSTRPIFWASRALTEGCRATRAPATNMRLTELTWT